MEQTAKQLTKPELIAHILKEGGKILIAGGSMEDYLPKQYKDHPQIIIWDDDRQGFTNKEVPSNTRVIMYNRWVSHPTAKKLTSAAFSLHALRFPMLRTREIKELLSEVVQTEAPQLEPQVIEEELQKEVDKSLGDTESTLDGTPKEVEVEKMPKKILSRGVLQDFIAKNIDVTKDYTARGSVSEEGRRLFDKAKQAGVKTTSSSIEQAVRIFIKTWQKNKGQVNVKPATKTPSQAEVKSSADDFEQLEVLIVDAIAAMKLVQEHLPKVKKETERLRGMRAKLMKFLSVE